MSEKERFHDNPSGIITDTQYQKHWLPKDSYGDLGKWNNFQEAKNYNQLMNQVYAGGHSDWRFPTKEEALQLYSTDLTQKDYEDQDIHIHPLFVSKCSYYMWTSETDDKGQAVHINLRNGNAEYVDKNSRENEAVRLVRDIKN